MILGAVMTVVMAVACFGTIRTLNYLGYFEHDFRQYPGTCSDVKGLQFGSEDFQTLSSGLTFISSGFSYAAFGPGYKNFLKEHDIKGRFYTVDLNKPETRAKEVKIKPGKGLDLSAFRPHGLSILEDSVNGNHLIYVINHCETDEMDRVEKFMYLPKSNELEHVKTFSSDLFHLTNDLALIEEDKFYISDYLYYKTHFMSTIEQVVGFKYGGILYFDGTRFTRPISRLFGPDGILLSKDKKFLYVALPYSQDFQAYAVKPNGALELVQELRLYTSIDNFHLTPDGTKLYGGCHPKTLKIFEFLEDPNLKTPAQVLQFPLKDGLVEEDKITQLFYDTGDLICGSSIANIHDKKLLVGSIMNRLTVCDL